MTTGRINQIATTRLCSRVDFTALLTATINTHSPLNEYCQSAKVPTRTDRPTDRPTDAARGRPPRCQVLSAKCIHARARVVARACVRGCGAVLPTHARNRPRASQLWDRPTIQGYASTRGAFRGLTSPCLNDLDPATERPTNATIRTMGSSTSKSSRSHGANPSDPCFSYSSASGGSSTYVPPFDSQPLIWTRASHVYSRLL